MKTRLKGVLFDYDGTLVDSEKIHLRLWNQVLGDYGVEISVDDYKRTFSGVPSPTSAERLVRERALPITSRDLVSRKIDAYHDWLTDNVVPLMRHARETVEYFSARGLRVGLVTGSQRRGVMVMLERYGLTGHFQAVVTSDDVARSKPDPESYLRALSELGIGADEALAFEDTASGIASARGAGVACCAVRNEFSAGQSLDGATAVVDTLEEAVAWTLEHYTL